VLAGWLVATWQVSLGFGIGLVFGYVLAFLGAVIVVRWLIVPGPLRGPGRWWKARRRPPRLLLLVDVLGAALFTAVAAVMAAPYLQVIKEHPHARRGLGEVRMFSVPAPGFLTSPAQSWFWGERHAHLRNALNQPQETSLLAGYVLIGLALAGLVYSVWSLRTRLFLLGGVALSVVLAMGTRGPFSGLGGYLIPYYALPGWDAIRTPGRLVLWTTLLLGLLAAGAVSAFALRVREYVELRVPARPGPVLRVAMVLPLLLVLAEGLSASPNPTVPRPPAALRDAEAPVLVLPTDPLNDMRAMIWSTDGFPKLVNGHSGFTPDQMRELREIGVHFPDEASIEFLRELGVRTVVVVKSTAKRSPFAAAATEPADELDIEREDTPDAVIFRL